MISFLQGRIATCNDSSIVLNVAGIGFSIAVAHPELFKKDTDISVIIHMQWNQEQGPSLYGFLHEQEKIIFLMILDCSGFGPKIALLILKKISPINFLKAIQLADLKAFSGISGIGPKKAEQLVVQLKHKVKDLLEAGIFESSAASTDQIALEQWKDISQALQSLNYSRQEIDRALQHIANHDSFTLSFDILLRKALTFLAKK